MSTQTQQRVARGTQQPPTQDWSCQIRRLRESLHVSQAEFARALGVTPMAVSQWESGKKEPSTDRYLQMGKIALPPDCWFFFGKAGLSRADIYRLVPELQAAVTDRLEKQRLPVVQVVPAVKVRGSGQRLAKMGYVALPLLRNEAAAGEPRLLDEREVESYVIVPLEQARTGGEWMTCIRVKGNSMEPILRGGYIVAVDASQSEPRYLRGKMVVALVGEGVTIKWLDRLGSQWVLTPENKSYRQSPLGRGDRIIGRVAWWYGCQE